MIDGERLTPTDRDSRPLSVDVVAAMEHVDWAATGVGPREAWPAVLQTMVRVVLGSRFSMWMGWGADLAFFYNDAYARDTLQRKHPWALGRPATEVWQEIWPDIGPRIEHVLATGEATWDEDLLLFLERSGFREETYHTFSYSPLFDSEAVVGMLCVVSETTDEVIGGRRMAMLRELGASLSACTTESEVVVAVGRGLAANPYDLPFSLAYLLDGDGDAQLVAAAGVSAGHAIAPALIDRRGGSPWWLPTGTVIVEPLPTTQDPPCGAWDVPPRQALLVPVKESGQERPTGFLAVGLNPYRPLDAEYLGFVELVAGQIAAAVSSARAFEAERRRSEALAALDQAKTTFFTNISHEFRTPLTLLLAPIEQTLAEPLEPGTRDRLHLAHRNALRMLKLVNALLDFSRLEAGRLRASLEPLDLAAQTADVAGMFRSAIEAGGVRLVVDCPPLGRLIPADRDMWELIVTNLLSNAFKHTFDGTIEVHLRLEGEWVRLDVSDTGTGIAEDQLPYLFARFHRVEGAPSRSYEGSGVGLSLVRELVERHDGTVHVESQVGVGSTFSVEIPARRPEDPLPMEATASLVPPALSRTLAAHLAEVEQWVSGGVDTDNGSTAEGVVLVVDDNADMRTYLARLLSPRFAVRTAVDGADALEQIRRGAPDVVVSDVMMPKVDGLELVRRLRADPDHADLPVVLLSARAGAEASAEGLDLGADDYLVKPFSGDELIGRVVARCGSGRERRRNRVLAALAEEIRDLTDPDQILAAVHRTAGELVGCARTSLAIRDGNLIRGHICPPIGGGVDARYHVIDEGSDAPIAVTIRTGRPILLGGAAEVARRFPDFAADHRSAGAEAAVLAPVRGRLDEVLGALGVAWDTADVVGDDALKAVDGIAAVVARSLEHLQLLRNEARVAEEIQSQFLELDSRPLNGVVAARYRPADSTLVVGGDWYDAIAVGDDRLGLAVGDVVGNGLPAALVMGQLRSALAAAAATGAPPDTVVGMVDAFAQRIPAASCTTIAYCLVEQVAGSSSARLRWTCAGHPPPVVADEHGVRMLWDGRRPPLGLADGRPMQVGTTTVGPGSLVILYTDGLVERRLTALDDRLDELCLAVARHRDQPVGELCDLLVADLTPAASTTDDLALIAVRIVGSTPTCFVDVIPALPQAIAGSRRRLREWLDEIGVGRDDRVGILLAVGEAVANAVEHGSRRRGERRVGIEVHRRGSRIVASITDTGSWDRDAARSAQLGRGRGFQIMQDLADDVAVDRTRLGSTVTLVLPLGGASARAPRERLPR